MHSNLCLANQSGHGLGRACYILFPQIKSTKYILSKTIDSSTNLKNIHNLTMKGVMVRRNMLSYTKS